MPLLNPYSQSPRGPLPAEPGRLQNSLHISPNLPAKAQGSRGRCSWCVCTLPLGVPVCWPVSRGDHAATHRAAGGRCRCRSPSPASPCCTVRCAAVAAAASLPPPDHAVLKVGPPQLSAAGPQLQLSRWLWPAAGSGSVPAARQPIDGRWTEVGVLRPATSFTWHLREKC